MIALSVGLNAVLIVAVLYHFFVGAGQQLNEFFIVPNYERRVSQFELMPIGPDDIVFIGDSITRGGSWYELFPEHSVRNRGIGGDTSAGVIQRLHQVTEGEPSKVFLLIGTNDLTFGTEISQTVANIVHIVDSIHADSPHTTVWVQSVLPRGASFRSDIEIMNAAIRRAIEGKAEWIDLYPLFLDKRDGSIRDDLSNDELHLMGEGYLIWRDTISGFIAR